MTNIVNFDIETKSELDLAEVGGYRYAMDPSTDVICVAWTSSTETGFWIPPRPPPVFNTDTEFRGYNILQFDCLIWTYILHRRYLWQHPDNFTFSDTMHRAAYTNLPGALDDVAIALNTPRKDPEGHKLMLQLCKPARAIKKDNNPWRHHTSDNILALFNYCAQDVVSERAVDMLLPPLPESEEKIIAVDTKVNARGMHIDMELVQACIDCADGIADHYREELDQITNGQVPKETALGEMSEFCRNQGMVIPDGAGAMDKEAIVGYLKADIPEKARRVLEIRQMIGRSSLSKLERMKVAVCSDNRIRGTLQYYGAHQTGRWAGRIIQPQNFPRRDLDDYDAAIATVKMGPDAMELFYGDDSLGVITALIRPCINACVGKQLVIADYNAIECRVLAWLADESRLLNNFRTGRCPYRDMASIIYGVPYEAVTDTQRHLGKTIILACGYGMGGKRRPNGEPARFQVTAELQRLIITDAQSEQYVDTYRDTFASIPRLWYAMDDAVKNAIRHPNAIYSVSGIHIKFDGVDLKIRKPNGALLWYRQARIEQRYDEEYERMRDTLTFMGEIAQGRWGRIYTYGAKIVENCFTRETKVLTSQGWRDIASVKSGDLVWDGISWVTTDGAICQGEEEVGVWLGVQVTQNHLIHDGSSWKPVIHLDESALAQCLKYGRDSAPSWWYGQNQGKMDLRIADATAEIYGRIEHENYDVGGVIAPYADGRKQQTAENEIRILSLTIPQEAHGLIGIQGSYLGAIVEKIKRTVITVAGALKCTGRGKKIDAFFYNTQRRYRIGISRAWTWIVGIIAQGMPPAIYGLSPANKIPRINGQLYSSTQMESGITKANSIEKCVPSGHTTPLHITPKKEKQETRFWSYTGKAKVYDLLDCGPRNRFMVLTEKGPIIVHNCAQSISRDLTAEALVRCENEGCDPILTVHDEIICESAHLTARSLEEIMCRSESWASGIPVKAKGFTSPYYRK